MKKIIVFLLLCCIASFSWFSTSSAQQRVKEPATKKEFPVTVSFHLNGEEHILSLTGVALRKKFVFKVYAMAHYMQKPPKGNAEEALEILMSDNNPKQITMEFVRNVSRGKIQDAFRKGFRENALGEQFKEIQPLVDQFCSYFDKDVKEGEQIIIRRLPGGVISTVVQGEVKPAISHESFARVLWAIWFGEQSIVHREKLVEQLISPAE
jgi:hypothetical protein